MLLKLIFYVSALEGIWCQVCNTDDYEGKCLEKEDYGEPMECDDGDYCSFKTGKNIISIFNGPIFLQAILIPVQAQKSVTLIQYLLYDIDSPVLWQIVIPCSRTN